MTLVFVTRGKENILVVTIGSQFIYIIPWFAGNGVEIRQVVVKAYGESGLENHYDLFKRTNDCLYRHYPAWLAIVIVKV